MKIDEVIEAIFKSPMQRISERTISRHVGEVEVCLNELKAEVIHFLKEQLKFNTDQQ
jgi:hypothetical protein